MEAIFHEKQEGSLCAQHCLNSLLQGPYFTAVDLSTLAEKLDEEERQRMAECGEESEEYRKFLQQPSENMDDSGYFSVQVISSALQVWGLELVPYGSNDERIKVDDPCKMKAYICNYKDHWLTIRKIGNKWFNLNSLLPKPELISNTYLDLFLAQLRNDGYSIFVVLGDFPECTADEVLSSSLEDMILKPTCSSNVLKKSDQDVNTSSQVTHKVISSDQTSEDEELQQALRLSMENFNSSPEEDDEESLLRKAINMSLQC